MKSKLAKIFLVLAVMNVAAVSAAQACEKQASNIDKMIAAEPTTNGSEGDGQKGIQTEKPAKKAPAPAEA